MDFTTVSGTLKKSYNASTGILTAYYALVGGYYWTANSYVTSSVNATVIAYLHY